MKLYEMNPSEIVPLFDEFLYARGIHFEAVIIGAGALNVMKVVYRQTVDLDILSPQIPPEIKELSIEFHKEMNSKGIPLIEHWLNDAPNPLLKDLSHDWESNTQQIYLGKAITFHTLSRIDLVRSKLFAYCDREERDLEDLKALSPTKDEILSVIPWLKLRDTHPSWPKHVENKIKDLLQELGDEL